MYTTKKQSRFEFGNWSILTMTAMAHKQKWESKDLLKKNFEEDDREKKKGCVETMHSFTRKLNTIEYKHL